MTAQPPKPPADAGAAATAPAMPTIPFADSNFGFEMQLPAAWSFDRTRFQQFVGSIGLLRGRSPGGERSLQVMIFRDFRMPPFEQWLTGFVKELASRTSARSSTTDDAQQPAQVPWEQWPIPPRTGAVLTLDDKIGASTTRTLYLLVPFDAYTVWALVFAGTANDEAAAKELRAEFETVARSVTVHYDPAEAEKLGVELERGKALIERIRARGEQARIDETERTYLVGIGPRLEGYLSRKIAREEYVYSKPEAQRRYAKMGLRVHERSWRFPEDGSARFTRVDLFSSFDGRSELMETQSSFVPAPDMKQFTIFVKSDQYVREDNTLISTTLTSAAGSLPAPRRPLSLGPVYLDSAWLRLLPGVLLGADSQRYAFVVYDMDTAGTTVHRIRPLGERALPAPLENNVRPPTGTCYAFEIYEGFIAQPGTVYVDGNGVVIRLDSGDLAVELTSEAHVNEIFGAKRDEAEKRLASKP